MPRKRDTSHEADIPVDNSAKLFEETFYHLKFAQTGEVRKMTEMNPEWQPKDLKEHFTEWRNKQPCIVQELSEFFASKVVE